MKQVLISLNILFATLLVVATLTCAAVQAGTWSTPVTDHTAIQVTPATNLPLAAINVDPKYNHYGYPVGSCTVGVTADYYFYLTSWPMPPLGRGIMTFWKSVCI